MSDRREQLMARVRDGMQRALAGMNDAALAFAEGSVHESSETAKRMRHCAETLLSMARMCDDLVSKTDNTLAAIEAVRREIKNEKPGRLS